MNTEASGVLNKIALLKVSLNELTTAYQNSSTSGGIKGVAQGISGIKGTLFSKITQDDINSIKEYNKLITQGTTTQTAWYRTMQNSSKAAQDLVIKANGATVNLEGLTTSANSSRLAMMGLTAATTALNIAFTLGLSLAIQGAIQLIDNLIHSEERAIQAAKETANKSYESAENIKSQQGELDTLISKYENLISRENIDADTRNEILQIQTDITQLVGTQANNLDLVNGKLSDELDKLRQIAQINLDSSIPTYEKAYLDTANSTEQSILGDDDWIKDFGIFKQQHEAKTEILDANKELQSALEDIKLEAGAEILTKYIESIKSKGKLNDTELQYVEGIVNETEGASEENKQRVLQAISAIKNGQNTYSVTIGDVKNILEDFANKSHSEQVEAIREDINYMENIEGFDYQNDDLWNKLVEVESELTGSDGAFTKQVKSASNLLESLTKANVGAGEAVSDIDEYFAYKKKIVDAIASNNTIQQAIDDGALTQEGIEKYVNSYLSTFDKYSQFYKKTEDDIIKISETGFELSEAQTKQIKQINSDYDKLNKVYNDLFSKKEHSEIESDVWELVSSFPELYQYIDWTDEKFGNLAEGIDKVVRGLSTDLVAELEAIDPSKLSDDGKKALQSIIDVMKMMHPTLKTTVNLIEDIQKAIKGVSSSISTLIGFTKEISSDGALSLSSIDTIMTDDTYKSLRPYINDMEGMQTAITELVAKQKDAYEDLYNAEMYENDYEAYRAELDKKESQGEAYLSKSIKEIQDEIKNIEQQYGVDLTNWNNLAETKKTILQNTNAELLSKQVSLINTFKSYYDTDLTNYKNTTAAKAAILDNFRQSEAFAQATKIAIDNNAIGNNRGNIYLADNDGSIKNKINSVLSASGLTWQDYVQYLNNGTFTNKGNEALQKTLDEIVKAYTITPLNWDNMTANIKGGSSSSSKSKNYIDWIERRLKKFARTTKEVFAKVADYISFNNQNSQLRKAINAIRDEIAVNEQSYQYYMEEANKVGLDPYWQWFVQNGARNISDIQDEVLREKINRYKELYDQAIDCKNAVEDLKKTEKEYANQMLSNVEKYYSNRIEYANADAEYYNSLDTDNVNLNKNFDAIRKSYNSQIAYTQKEHDDLLNTLNSLVSSGSIKYQSDEWYEWWAKIQKCNVEVRNLKKSIHDLANEELQNIQGYWDNRIGVYNNTVSYLNAIGGDSTRKGSKDYKGLSSAYNTQIGYTNKQVSELQLRLDKAVKAGDIEKYSDKWYEWIGIIEQGKEKVVELQTSIHQLAVDEFNDIATRYDNLINRIEHKNNLLEESISQTQEKGYIVSTKYYNTLITNEQNNISKLSGKRNDLYANLQQAIKSGNIQEGSEEWHKMVQEIENVDLEIAKANTSVIKFNNSIRDIKWQIFDLLQDKISQISAESNFLINLMKNDNLYVKKGQGVGQLTNQGLSTMGLHGVNYNVYMAQSNKYAQEILKIDKQLAKDPYNQTLINRRKELLKLQQDMIISANDEKQAIVSMIKEGIDLELNALKELIDKYNKALDVQKDLYDYQKRVKEQTKEITSLQKQLMAYTNDSSEETKAKVQQLKVSLETAKENLQETQYDKFISDQKKLLDDLYDDYETTLNQRLDNIDSFISDMIDNINNNTDTIKQTLIDVSGNVGYQISSTMNDIWNSGTKPVLSEYNTNFLNTSNNVISAINNLTNSINNMIIALDNTANKNNTVKTTSKQPTTTVKQTTPANNSTNKTNTNSSKNNTNTNSNKSTNGTNSGFSKGSTSGTSSGFGKGSTNNNSTQKNTNNKKTRTDKENYGVALAIWNGNYGWGAGSTRVKRLTAKGFDANKIQSIVNKMGKDGYVFTGSWYGKYYGIKDLSPYHYNKYKQGQYSINHNQIAWTNENGNSEVIIRRSDGAILTPLAKDDMILNSQATDNLFSIATDPNTFIKESLFGGQNNAGTANINNVNNNCSVSIDTVSFNLPNVKNYEDFFYAAQHDKRFEKMVQAMTVDKLFGGSSLKKYRV